MRMDARHVRRAQLRHALKRGASLLWLASSGVPGERHSAYHEYLSELIEVKDRLFTKTARKIAA